MMMDEEQMNEMIAGYLPNALADQQACPPVEIWAAVLNGDIPEQACTRLVRHADHCVSCANERSLARQFLSEPDNDDEDVDWIVARLQQAKSATDKVVPFPGRWRLARPLLGLAAAAMLVLAFAPLLGVLTPVTVVTPPETGISRGSEVIAIEPSGEIDAYPAQLAWQRHGAADSYRLTVTAVDGDKLWQRKIPGNEDSVTLPGELLHPYVVYYWQVEALQADGTPAAKSRKTRFRFTGRAQ